MPLLRYEPWWRMPDSPKHRRARRRVSAAAISFAGYWIVALGAAYAVHAEWLPARRWLVASTSTTLAVPQARIGRTIEMPADTAPVEPGPPLPFVEPPPLEPEIDEEPIAAREPEPIEEPQRTAPVERKRERKPERKPERNAKRERRRERTIEPPEIAERTPEPTKPEPTKPERTKPERMKPEPSKPATARAERPRPSSGGGTSCEAAIGSYRESIRMGDRSTPPDISQARYAAVLNRGTYFQHCGVPDTSSIRICAAVQHGRAVGVTVTTSPPSASQQRCIANAVRGLSFPSHPRMDVTTTVFE